MRLVFTIVVALLFTFYAPKAIFAKQNDDTRFKMDKILKNVLLATFQ